MVLLLNEDIIFILVFWPWGMWTLSSLTRDWTPCIESPSLEGEVLTIGPPGKSLGNIVFENKWFKYPKLNATV